VSSEAITTMSHLRITMAILMTSFVSLLPCNDDRRAYETAAAQNARSLGRPMLTQRRGQRKTTTADRDHLSRSMPSAEGVRPIETLNKSSHAVFFGTDDIATLEKVGGKAVTADEPDDIVIEDNVEQTKEWMDICALARDVFGVYFSIDETFSEIERSKEQREKRFIYKINGTMPWLSDFLKSLRLPGAMTSILLFAEASLRGIAQVFFQNNPLSGLFILVAMFIQSTRVAVHGVIAVIVGNLAGILMGFDRSFVSCGKILC
jgi:hypothetical protein